MEIAFVHPSLGLGGSERLITDAAYVLAQRGHDVSLFTAEFDRTSAFDEARSGLFQVRVHGALLPTGVAGRLRAPANILRTSYLALRAALHRCDLVFVDLVAHVLPIVRGLSRARIVYYCHFPDVLLTPQDSRSRRLYRLYRWPLDAAEARALQRAHLLLVNSQFTASVLRATFPRVAAPIEVLNPGVDVTRYRPRSERRHARDDAIILLSIARYQPAKGLPLAVEALAAMRPLLPRELFARVRLVQAGGLDEHAPGALETYDDLMARARTLGVDAQVELRTSVSDEEKLSLLARARALVYTPDREHFGIVPLEAMACGVPVVAVASGGPRETILDGETGFLCQPMPEAFAERLAMLVRDEALARQLGTRAVEHATRTLSRGAFADRLELLLRSCCDARQAS